MIQLCEPPNWDSQALERELPRHVLTGSMRYTDFEHLGIGGKAEVFRCRDVNLDRQVAFKVLHRSLADNALEQQMLVREARIMATLGSGAVPAVHDLGRDENGRPYFTMELIAGETLHEALTSLREGKQGYQVEELLALVLKTSEALRNAHQLNILHGDIKPENIMIAASGGVYLLDWGLARITSEPERDEERIETTWGRQGSALYMSPEQVTREEHLQPCSDVYSLGVVLYECLTLKNPVQGATAQETLQMVVEAEPEPLSLAAPEREYSAELESLCRQALAKSPEDRISTMVEFCQRLRDCHLEILIQASCQI